MKRILCLILLCASVAHPLERLINHCSPMTVNGFVVAGDTLWAASGGGLVSHDLKNGSSKLLSSAKMFPDPNLTSICRDPDGNLWMTSDRGYLYKRTQDGRFAVYSTYHTSAWRLTSVLFHDGMVIVGANKGVSLFDPEKKVALRNGVNIADFTNPRVNRILVFEDTLFLACEEGVAYLDSLDDDPLKKRNFYYAGIWKTRPDSAVVKDLVVSAGSVLPQPSPSVVFQGRLLTSRNGNILSEGEVQAYVAPSGNITSLYNENDERLWIGTDETYYFSYDGEREPVEYGIEGIPLKQGTKILAASTGDVWVVPAVPRTGASWHHGVARYDGNRWSLYSNSTLGPAFGWIGEGDAFGISEGDNGSVWVGTYGGNVKHIDPFQNSVGQLVVRDYSSFRYTESGEGDIPWGKVDALARDSSKFLWMTVWESPNVGSVVCYDPRYKPVSSETDPVKAHFRRFFPASSIADNKAALHVDKNNRIYLYNGNNRLVIFRHNGNPLADGIETVYESQNIGLVTGMETGEDGATYITTSKGLYRIGRNETKLSVVDSELSAASCLAVQGSILWMGTSTNGMLRYDILTGEQTSYDEGNGMLSNNILSLSYNEKDGELWILTDVGVTQMDVGAASTISRSENMKVYPNPFSMSRKNQGTSSVTFARLAPRSTVSVYSFDGSLVSKVDSRYVSDYEWRAEWTPDTRLSPGTYFVVASPSGKKTKLMLLP
ncbi:MAG: two-component regulator propeller domain-containing protein [Chitinispirillaceae bacterium]